MSGAACVLSILLGLIVAICLLCFIVSKSNDNFRDYKMYRTNNMEKFGSGPAPISHPARSSRPAPTSTRPAPTSTRPAQSSQNVPTGNCPQRMVKGCPALAIDPWPQNGLSRNVNIQYPVAQDAKTAALTPQQKLIKNTRGVFNPYYQHSPGEEQPLVREEGPLPIQGNVGSIIGRSSNGLNEGPRGEGITVGGGGNLTAKKNPHLMVTAPELYGSSSFGLVGSFDYEGKSTLGNGMKSSSGSPDKAILRTQQPQAHEIAGYNWRVAPAGQGPSKPGVNHPTPNNTPCNAWIPAQSPNDCGTCSLNYDIRKSAYQQVGNWSAKNLWPGVENPYPWLTRSNYTRLAAANDKQTL